MARPTRPRRGPTHQVRIIGGRWRRRRLAFPSRPELRPTPDRVRETLFNWLGPRLDGARVLDLFAGSGALGLEALSRGAAQVLLLESDPEAVAAIQESIQALGAAGARVERADALAWLADGPTAPRPRERFDLVFVDPPYGAGLLAPALERLAASGRLAPGARIYFEQPARDDRLPLPGDWTLLREGRAGEVRFALAEAGPGPADGPAHEEH